MYHRAIRNDVLRSRAITLTTVLLVAATAMLVALASILVVNLSGAINTLMSRAQTPHFMQMHAGDLDMERLTAFAEQQPAVADFQVVEFLNVDSAQIVIEGTPLAGTVQDNGFSMQGEGFDHLLDLDGNPIRVADGEVYVPIAYMHDGTAQVGETLTVGSRSFTIAGPLRDSQMQSLLSSSKRFLVSPNDFAAVRAIGSVEYLIEFRLHDLAALGEFETAYADAGLEANGPTITHPLFRMLNGLSDGLMIGVMLLVSALVIAIAFLCIRFTLLAKIEEDNREIGVMKAIGLPIADIKKVYLAKYAAIGAAGSILGFGLSLFLRHPLLANIRLYMGESDTAALAPILGVIGVILVFLAILIYVNHVLNGFRRISPVEAIRFGVPQEKHSAGKRFPLSANTLLGTNVFLGVKDVLARKRLYGTMLTVLVLAAFIVIVPQNLHNTVASQGFITYMGVGDSDLRIDVQQTEDVVGAANIAATVASDDAISQYAVLTTKSFTAILDDGSRERIKVELGDHSVFPLTYASGGAPTADDEIALSVLLANEMGKSVGDALPFLIAGKERILTVSGLYSDVTNGGRTAKAAFVDDSAETMWSVVSAALVDPSLIDQKVEEYAAEFRFAKVSGIDGFIAQTYGSTISAIGKAALAAAGVALTITGLITLLFMRMLVTKDRYSIAVMKAFGFSNSDIKAQYVARSVFVLIIAVLLGTVLANTLGEVIASAVIGSFGAASFAFNVNPLSAYLLSPLLMVAATLLATVAGTWDAGQIRIAQNIKE
jgi:putative ABC transport system permease protein